jgi:hypothetical protein
VVCVCTCMCKISQPHMYPPARAQRRSSPHASLLPLPCAQSASTHSLYFRNTYNIHTYTYTLVFRPANTYLRKMQRHIHDSSFIHIKHFAFELNPKALERASVDFVFKMFFITCFEPLLLKRIFTVDFRNKNKKALARPRGFGST